jgi:formamidase
MHFSQGDGEVSFCGAIEMSGFLELKCSVIKNGMQLLPVVGPSPLSVNPIFEIGPLEPRYSEWLVFEGISVDEHGVQHYLGKIHEVCSAADAWMSLLDAFWTTIILTAASPGTDATIAYKRAVLNCIKYLAKFGYTEEQVYLLLSCIPCEGRISGIVDVPNAVATLAIPLAIFDRDVRPPATMDRLEVLAQGIRVLNKNVCISPEGGAVPYDPRLG